MKAVLTYHSIDDSGSPISVSPAAFAAHLEWMSTSGIPVVSLDSLKEWPASRGDAIAVTFDDAFESARAPIAAMLARQLPATLFVVSGHVGRTNSWGGRQQVGIPELPLLDWNALGALVEQGASIGAHTRSHPRLSSLSADDVDRELEDGQADVHRHLGVRPLDFAYPYGDENGRVRQAAKKYYARAYSTEFRICDETDDVMSIPRLDAYYFQRPGTLEAWGTSAFRRKVAWCRFRRRVRAALP
jgi:peptidoglycan/xylan/chitin deacetylase (PgdA/CDA1 family)